MRPIFLFLLVFNAYSKADMNSISRDFQMIGARIHQGLNMCQLFEVEPLSGRISSSRLLKAIKVTEIRRTRRKRVTNNYGVMSFSRVIKLKRRIILSESGWQALTLDPTLQAQYVLSDYLQLSHNFSDHKMLARTAINALLKCQPDFMLATIYLTDEFFSNVDLRSIDA